MAEVLLSTLADALGGPVVADATFTATASRARAVGDGVVANKTITVSVVQGVPSEPILLDHSGVDWCWRLRVVFPSIGVRIDRTVAVPDVPSVEWADLVDVDPATLLPSESAVPAWTAAVGQVAAALADTETARDGAVTAQGLSEAARDAAVLARGIAEIARDGAVVAQGASEDARAGAEAARDLALAGQFAGSDLGTADLNTIITPGVYHQATPASATLARNYPAASLQYALTVLPGGGSIRHQELVVASGPGAGYAKYARIYTGVAWTSWQAIPVQRVDETSGRAIFTWDYKNNRWQLIYGDTGWRDITASVGSVVTGGSVFVRRYGATVFITLLGVTVPINGTVAGALPIGFRIAHAVALPTPYGSITTWDTNGNLAFSALGTGRYVGVTFLAGDTWPTTLPGTPVGSIPS